MLHLRAEQDDLRIPADFDRVASSRAQGKPQCQTPQKALVEMRCLAPKQKF